MMKGFSHGKPPGGARGILAASLLAFVLAGCVETRARAHAQCEAQFIATGMGKEESRRMRLQLACMRAAGYQAAADCMWASPYADALSVGCWEPAGTVWRWVFNVDHYLRSWPESRIKRGQ
jgi:hypothetical protein